MLTPSDSLFLQSIKYFPPEPCRLWWVGGQTRRNSAPRDSNPPGLAHANQSSAGRREASNQPGPAVGRWHTKHLARWPRRARPESACRKAKKMVASVELTPSSLPSLPPPSSFLPVPSPSPPGPTRTALANLPQGPFSSLLFTLFLSVGFLFGSQCGFLASLSTTPPKKPNSVLPASRRPPSSPPCCAVAWSRCVAKPKSPASSLCPQRQKPPTPVL